MGVCLELTKPRLCRGLMTGGEMKIFLSSAPTFFPPDPRCSIEFHARWREHVCCLQMPLSAGHRCFKCILKGNTKGNRSPDKTRMCVEDIDVHSGDEGAFKETVCLECPESSWPWELRERIFACEQSPCQLVAEGDRKSSLAQSRLFQPAREGLAKGLCGSVHSPGRQSSWHLCNRSVF